MSIDTEHLERKLLLFNRRRRRLFLRFGKTLAVPYVGRERLLGLKDDDQCLPLGIVGNIRDVDTELRFTFKGLIDNPMPRNIVTVELVPRE